MPLWSDENRNVASAVALVASGAASMVVSGGARMVHSYVAGVESTLPARSVACTRNTWSPGERSVYSIGESHDSSGSASSEHSNVAPPSAANVNPAVVCVVVAAGSDRILVSGGVVSGGARTVQ